MPKSKVHYRGFHVKCGPTPLAEVFHELAQSPIINKDFRGYRRSLFLADDPSFVYGLLLTQSGHNGFCQIKLDENRNPVEMIPGEATEGNNLGHFNYFAINKSTWCGMYQHYTGSCGIAAFGSFLRERESAIERRRKQEEIDDASNRPGKTNAIQQIKRRYKSSKFGLTEILTPEDAAELIRQMSMVSGVSYRYAEVQSLGGFIAPVQKEVKTQRTTLLFTKEGKIKQAVRNTFARLASTMSKDETESTDDLADGSAHVAEIDIDDLVVTGRNSDGDAVTYKVGKSFRCFHSVEFDKVVKHIRGGFGVDALRSNKIIASLIRVMHENKKEFLSPRDE
jgi:hypothetical protein